MINHYIKAFCQSLYPRELVLKWRMEQWGISREEADYKSSRDVIEEMMLAMCSLQAIFDKTHPDNKLYAQIELKKNHYELWSYIENNLRILIENVRDLNSEPLSCPSCGN